MYPPSFLLLISAVYCQISSNDTELRQSIAVIFGKPPEGIPTSTVASNNNATAVTTGNVANRAQDTTTIAPATNNDVDSTVCPLKDGRRGECVSYYLCNGINNTIIRDGAGVIDIRSGKYAGYVVTTRVQDGLCPSYIDTCCDVGDMRPANDPIKPIRPNQVKREGCGWRNPDGADFQTTGDVDGETKFGEFPWVCALLESLPLDDDESQRQAIRVFLGSGSLIHPSVVLTAAHHLAKSQVLRVRAGEWDTQTTKEIYPFQDRDVASFAIHESYNKANLFYDVAVLFLSKPMDLAPNVALACLPPPMETTPEDTRCFVAGWGKDKFGMEGQYQTILKKVELPVVDHMECQKLLRLTRLFKYFELHFTFMCAGGEEGVDACRGDGGAPLSCSIVSQQDRFVQSGIVAWGIGCAMADVPGVYANVAVLRDWIDEKVSGMGYDTKVYTY